MKISIDVSPDYSETEILNKCKQVDVELQKAICLLEDKDKKIAGVLEGTTYFIDHHDIYYFESVDKKTFLYTETQVLETP